MDRSKAKNATVFDKSLATRGKTEVKKHNCMFQDTIDFAVGELEYFCFSFLGAGTV